ncbi:MAG: hypothetical protein WBO32_17230, partial [Cyclobacteriaceae bacterium]
NGIRNFPIAFATVQNGGWKWQIPIINGENVNRKWQNVILGVLEGFMKGIVKLPLVPLNFMGFRPSYSTA